MVDALVEDVPIGLALEFRAVVGLEGILGPGRVPSPRKGLKVEALGPDVEGRAGKLKCQRIAAAFPVTSSARRGTAIQGRTIPIRVAL